ncbi:hypothetical protein ACUN9Y_05115 [Halomonas sp. V046]|uniref:hypothetical protein n=1 Tax=Halomonas sp. V046 TaxID=3459611 RepID=UPI004043E423
MMLASPGSALSPGYLIGRLSRGTAALLYLCFLCVDIVLVHHIANRMPGGNPMLWSFDGALYEFGFLRDLLGGLGAGPFWRSLFFWVSIFWKCLVDLMLITFPAIFAIRVCEASREHLELWVLGYLYLLAGCDVLLVLAMLPWLAFEQGWLAIDAQRAAVVTHFLEIWVAGLNLLLFFRLYRQVFGLDFQQAYLGWFVLNIALGVGLGSALLICVY